MENCSELDEGMWPAQRPSRFSPRRRTCSLTKQEAVMLQSRSGRHTDGKRLRIFRAPNLSFKVSQALYWATPTTSCFSYNIDITNVVQKVLKVCILLYNLCFNTDFQYCIVALFCPITAKGNTNFCSMCVMLDFAHLFNAHLWLIYTTASIISIPTF